ncbi:MAG: protein translocase subunit SecF [Nevskia sp.]
MRIFSKVPNIDFMAQRKRALVISGLLTLAAVICILTRGLNLGIDFKGGVLVEVEYPQSVELDVVRADLAKAGYSEAVVQHLGGTSQVLIRVLPDPSASSDKIGDEVLKALHPETSHVVKRHSEFVGPQVGQELKEDGVLALLAAFGGIFLYVMFRFEWKFSAGSIAALTHDAIMTVGFLSLVQEEFDLTVLAGILAMLGYSNNETIVIFDRIRENLIGLRQRTVSEVINLSINQTLLRSIITHFTVLMVLSSLYFFGGKSVHGFSVAMIVGVLVATYSSIYVSSGVTVLLALKREDLLPPEDKDEKVKAEKLAKAENDGAVV